MDSRSDSSYIIFYGYHMIERYYGSIASMYVDTLGKVIFLKLISSIIYPILHSNAFSEMQLLSYVIWIITSGHEKRWLLMIIQMSGHENVKRMRQAIQFFYSVVPFIIVYYFAYVKWQLFVMYFEIVVINLIDIEILCWLILLVWWVHYFLISPCCVH